MTELAFSYPKATVGKRILAYLIDAMIVTVPIGILIPISIVPFFGYVRYESFEGPVNTAPNIMLIIFMVLTLALSFGWALFYGLLRDGFGAGQSWGKKICGLMVVNLNTNAPCNKVQSLVRNVFALLISGSLSWLPVVNGLSSLVEPIVALVHEKGQRVGDMVGNTQVIDLEFYEPYIEG